jgi:2-dehydropantoate 2-reductase
MKVAIIGSGAMGSLFAARLAPLVPVTMVAHWEPQLAALQQHGLTIEEPDGRRRHLPAGTLRVTSDVGEVGASDLALVLVKSYQTERAAGEAARVLAPDGLALTLQNGLGNLESLATAVGSERALAGTTSEGATLLAPGLVRHAGRGITYLCLCAPEQRSRVAALATLLEEAGFATRLEEDVMSLLWAKVAVNAGINPLTALLERPNGFLARHEPARTLMIAAAAETEAVAAALGLQLSLPPAGERVVQVAQATAANTSSMLQDRRNGRPTELEAITGAVVASAVEMGVAAPINDALLTLARAAERGEPWRAQVASLEPPALRQLFQQLAELPTVAEEMERG